MPIVYAQIEGICFDVTGKPFFNYKDGAKAVDARTLASLDEALPAARKWFSERADTTAADGTPSRHGVLHGRELAYDNRTISTKAFVLLLAVMEWAQPSAAELGEWFEQCASPAPSGPLPRTRVAGGRTAGSSPRRRSLSTGCASASTADTSAGRALPA